MPVWWRLCKDEGFPCTLFFPYSPPENDCCLPQVGRVAHTLHFSIGEPLFEQEGVSSLYSISPGGSATMLCSVSRLLDSTKVTHIAYVVKEVRSGGPGMQLWFHIQPPLYMQHGLTSFHGSV